MARRFPSQRSAEGLSAHIDLGLAYHRRAVAAETEVERLTDLITNLAAAIEARADELGRNGPSLGHPVLIECDGYVSGMRAAAEIVRGMKEWAS